MPSPLFHVDAFTDTPFHGNPAAVCVLDQPRDAAWMSLVAREMNLSETAFLVPAGRGWSLRWFTPEVEVDLCGHATLAAAHVLWETGRLAAATSALFETRSGDLEVRRAQDGSIVLDFPASPAEPATIPAPVIQALGVTPVASLACGPRWLVEVDAEERVRALQPDFPRMRSVSGRAVMVTAAASVHDGGYDFVSRYFAPWVGVDEDPVTGVAHCCLGPYWGARLNRAIMTGYQASSRGGSVRIELRRERVLLSGRAVIVASGTLG